MTRYSREAVVCPLCEERRGVRLFESRDRIHHLAGVFTVYRCVGCRAVFYGPELSPATLASYYPATYGRHQPSPSLEKKGYDDPLRRFVLEQYYGYPAKGREDGSGFLKPAAFLLSLVVARDAVPYRGEGRVLDIGCGSGSYLYRLKRWGWKTYGVETNGAAAARASALGLEVYHGDLLDARFSGGYFDMVRLNHVLEHLPNPKEVFMEIGRVLKPHGRVYVTIPNTRSLNFRLFGTYWFGLDVPRHVISYCPESLQYLCRVSGMRIEGLRYKAGVFNFVRSIHLYLQEHGEAWPRWVRGIDWPRNRFIRRALKPLFFAVDVAHAGDTFEARLRKRLE